MGWRSGHRLLLPAIQGLMAFTGFAAVWRVAGPAAAALTVGGWALGTTLLSVPAFRREPDRAERVVLRVRRYRDEMLDWLFEGRGPSDHPLATVLAHLRETAVYLVAAVLTANLLALMMGAVLLNMMNAWVARLTQASRRPAVTNLLAWPVWSVVRVAAFVALGAAAAAPLARFVGWPGRAAEVRWLAVAGVAGVLLDLMLKLGLSRSVGRRLAGAVERSTIVTSAQSLLVAGVVLLSALGPAAAETLLVANKTDDTVHLIDPASGEKRAELPTGHAPHEVAVSPDGRTAVISNYGDRDEPGGTLTVIDVREPRVLRTIQLDRHQRPHGLAFLSERILAVTAERTAHLLIVDVEGGELLNAIETAQRVSHMVAVTSDGKRAFVANIQSGTVTAIDVPSGKKLGDVKTGAGAEGIAVTPDGKQVWVTNREAGTLSVLDAAALKVLATIPCPGFPIRVAITPDGKRALVSCARNGEVALFDVATREELRRAKLDLSTVPDAASRLFGERFAESPAPVGLVIHPDGKIAWVAATQSDVVVVLDTATLEVRDLIEAGREPDGMAYTPTAVYRPAPRRH